MNYSPFDNQLPSFKREGLTERINSNSTGSIKKSVKNHVNASNLRSNIPSNFRNPYMLFSIHKYQELARNKGKMNRKDLAQAVQKAWNDLTPNERLYWFQDSSKQPTMKAKMLESRASRGLILKKQKSLNINDSKFKNTETDNNDKIPSCSFHHKFLQQQQNSLNFEDIGVRDTDINNEFVSSNRSIFSRSRSNSDVFQSSSSDTNYHSNGVYKTLLNQYDMIIESASRERESTTLTFWNSQNNKSCSDNESFNRSMVSLNNHMVGEKLTRSEYETLMKGYKDIIDDAIIQKTTLEFKIKSYNRSNKHKLSSSESNLPQMYDEISYVSTVISNNISDGNFDRLADKHHDFYSPHARQQHEMSLPDFNELFQLHMSSNSLPPLETLENECKSHQQYIGNSSIPKSDYLSSSNVLILQNSPNNNNIGIISGDVHDYITNVDFSNNNFSHNSISNNDYSDVASLSLKDVSKLTTKISDRTSGGSIPKVSLHRDEYNHDSNNNEFRSHYSRSSIPTASLCQEDSNNDIKLKHSSDMKRKKFLWKEINNNNITNTMNNHHQLCQETWMYAKNILSPMFEDNIKEHSPEYATTNSAVAVAAAAAAAALNCTDDDGVDNMDDNPSFFMQQFDNYNKINEKDDEDDDGCLGWESQNNLDESFH